MEHFREFVYEKDIVIKVGDIDTIEIFKDGKQVAYINKDNLIFLLARMGHNEKFYLIPKYFYVECINEVFNAYKNSHLFMLYNY